MKVVAKFYLKNYLFIGVACVGRVRVGGYMSKNYVVWVRILDINKTFLKTDVGMLPSSGWKVFHSHKIIHSIFHIVLFRWQAKYKLLMNMHVLYV